MQKGFRWHVEARAAAPAEIPPSPRCRRRLRRPGRGISRRRPYHCKRRFVHSRLSSCPAFGSNGEIKWQPTPAGPAWPGLAWPCPRPRPGGRGWAGDHAGPREGWADGLPPPNRKALGRGRTVALAWAVRWVDRYNFQSRVSGLELALFFSLARNLRG